MSTPHLSLYGDQLVKVICNLPESFEEHLTLSDAVQIFLSRVAFGDDFFHPILSILDVSEKDYIRSCLATEKPLLFPEAIQMLESMGDTKRKYVHVPTEPLVEAYIQKRMLFVGSITETRAVALAENCNNITEAATSAAQKLLLDMCSWFCTCLTEGEAKAFIGIPFTAIPESVYTIEACDVLWLVGEDGNISNVVTLDFPFDDEPDIEVYIVSKLFCAETEDMAKELIAGLKASGRTVSGDIRVMEGAFCR